MKVHSFSQLSRGLLAGGFLIAIFATVFNQSYAQNEAEAPTGVCRTDLSQAPALAPSDCDGTQTVPGPYLPDPTVRLFRIPVVFHVISNSTETHGYIDDQTILDQMQVLNESFRAIPGSPGRNGTDTRIEFYLAGVTRHADDEWFTASPDVSYEIWDGILDTVNWDTDAYFNIYTFGFTDACHGVGYSSPGNRWDAALVDWRGVGGAATPCQGRLVVHETGEYLNLRHPSYPGSGVCSEDIPPPNDCSETFPGCYTCGDLICDTNPMNSSNLDGNNPFESTCGNGYDPIYNYMTYAFYNNDNFTPEQAARMRCGLLTYRPLLYEIGTITISGTVSSQGAPCEGIEVVAIEEGSGATTATDVTDALGQYSLVLPDGWPGTVEVAKTLYYNDTQPTEYTFPPDPYDDRDFTVYHTPTTWSPNGLPVNILDNTGHRNKCVATTGDNIFVAWADDRHASGEYDAYVQSFTSDGDMRWPLDVVLCDAAGDQVNMRIVSDGLSGAIIAWQDHRNGSVRVYVQRIDADGNAQWGTNGMEVGFGEEPSIVPDGSGGAILVWNGGSGSILAQHVEAGGYFDPNWQLYGTAIRLNGDYVFNLDITTDGAAGAIATWQEWQSPTSIDIWAQRVDAGGVPQWPSPGSTTGVTVKPDPSSRPQELPAIASDGAGGAYIVFRREIVPLPNDEYHVMAQRLGPDGTPPPPWNQMDLVIDNRPGKIYSSPELAPGGQSGFVVMWEHNSVTWAQKYDAAAGALWGSHVQLVPYGSSIEHLNLAADGFGGANFVSSSNVENPGVWIQKVTSSGSRSLGLWGVQIGDNAEGHGQPKMVSDVAGRPIVVWVGERTNDDGVYIHRENASVVSTQIAAYVLKNGAPQPLPDQSAFGCPLGDADIILVEVTFLDVQRDIQAAEITVGQPEVGDVVLWFQSAPVADGPATSGNGYTTTITIGDNNNEGFSGCGTDLIPILLNGAKIGQATIRATSADYNLDGAVDLVDFSIFGPNFPSPPEPYDLCSDFNDDGVIDLPDFSLYGSHFLHESPWVGGGAPAALAESSVEVVYKVESQVAGNTVRIPVSLTGALNITTLMAEIELPNKHLEFKRWEPSPTGGLNAFVTTSDVHGKQVLMIGIVHKEGLASDAVELGTLVFECGPGANLKTSDLQDDWKIVSGQVMNSAGESKRIRGIEVIETPGVPEVTNHLARNVPNPFNPSTVIGYSIAEDTHVRLKIYNVAGQEVRTLVDELKPRNVHSVEWDGTDNNGRRVSSGVYFYKLQTSTFNMTRKLVLLK